MVRDNWVQLPSSWIDAKKLWNLRWVNGQGANNTAALMALIAIAHNVNPDTGLSKVTYDQLCDVTGLSRAKLSAGLKVLIRLNLIQTKYGGRSIIKLENYGDGSKWAKFPARALYSSGTIRFLQTFTLRNPAELNALKLFMLIATRRDGSQNITTISYNRIIDYTGIERNSIRAGLSILVLNGLIHIEKAPSDLHNGALYNVYRMAYIDPYGHSAAQVRA